MLQSCTFHNRTSDVWCSSRDELLLDEIRATGREVLEVKAICQTAHQGRVATLTIGANKSVGWYVLTSHADYFFQTIHSMPHLLRSHHHAFSPSIRTVRIKVRISHPQIQPEHLRNSFVIFSVKSIFWKQWSPKNVQKGCWADSCWNQSPDHVKAVKAMEAFQKNASKHQGIRIVPVEVWSSVLFIRDFLVPGQQGFALCLDHQTRWKECGFFMPIDKYATCSNTLYEYIWYHWQSFRVHMGNLTVEICRNVRTICMHASSMLVKDLQCVPIFVNPPQRNILGHEAGIGVVHLLQSFIPDLGDWQISTAPTLQLQVGLFSTSQMLRSLHWVQLLHLGHMQKLSNSEKKHQKKIATTERFSRSCSWRAWTVMPRRELLQLPQLFQRGQRTDPAGPRSTAKHVGTNVAVVGFPRSHRHRQHAPQ